MAKVCSVCGKKRGSGNNVTFSHRGIKRYWEPNLQKVRVYDEKGNSKRVYVCTRCLRSGKVNRHKPIKNIFEDAELNAQGEVIDGDLAEESKEEVDEAEAEDSEAGEAEEETEEAEEE